MWHTPTPRHTSSLSTDLLYLFNYRWTLKLLPYFITINNSVINMEVNTSFCAHVFVFFREILGSRSARSYDSSHLHILRNLHIVFLSGCTNFHSDQQCTRVPFAPHPYKHLLFIAILTGEGNGTPLQYSCLENPWTEEPGMLQSMRSPRVGHD